MRGQMLKALQSHVKASIELHKAINKIYLANLGGIGEHSDILEAVQTELDKMSVHSDRSNSSIMWGTASKFLPC